MSRWINRILESNLYSSILAGILLGLSFSPFDLVLLCIPAFMLLIRIVDRSESIRQVMYYTFPGFLIWNIITSYWLTFATFGGGVAAILANSVIMTIPLGLMRHVRRSGLNTYLVALLCAAVWVSYEFLHFRWDLAWPWLVAGNAFANAPQIVQYISLTGVMGISFWVVFSASLLTSIGPNRNQLWFAVAIISAPALGSLLYYATATHKPDAWTEIVVVQPNYDSYLPDAGYSDTSVALEELIALTDSVRTPKTTAIFWPENAIMQNIHQGSNRYPVDRLIRAARAWNAPVISGATWYEYYTDVPPPRVSRDTGIGSRFNIFNSAIGFYPDGTIRNYNKGKLVPIVERFPFIEVLGLLPDSWYDWGRLSGYGRGGEIVNFEVGETLAPAMICYDSVFPDWVRRAVKDGAGFIAVVTNDGWWGNTSGHTQHYDFARLRAVETRRAVVRSANNGISGMIYPSGDVHSRTTYWTRTALNINVPVYSKQTFYVRFGDWIGALSLLSVAGFLIYRRRKSGVASPTSGA